MFALNTSLNLGRPYSEDGGRIARPASLERPHGADFFALRSVSAPCQRSPSFLVLRRPPWHRSPVDARDPAPVSCVVPLVNGLSAPEFAGFEYGRSPFDLQASP